MTVDNVVETVMYRPLVEVARYATDPSNAAEWYANIDAVDWRTPPPLAVGSRIDFIARFLGRRLACTNEVAELDPGRRLVMRTSQGPFPMETREVEQERTAMRLGNRGEHQGSGVSPLPPSPPRCGGARPRTWSA